MQKLIVSLKLSRYCPRLCFEPHRRAARPSSPSRTTPAMMRTDVSSHRWSITYVIARKPRTALATVMTYAGETLRTHAIRLLRDHRSPRAHAVAHRHPQRASGRQLEFDPRPEADQPDALALLDLIPGRAVRDNSAREDPRDLVEPEDPEGGLELPFEPLVSPGVAGGRDRVSARAVPHGADDSRHRGPVHVHVGHPHEDRDPPRGRVRDHDPAVGGGHDARPDLARRVPEEEQERDEREAERD